jgi:hypothetical protein
MKWPWTRSQDRVIDALIEEHQYSNLDRLDGLEESIKRHPSRGTWHDSHHYEEKYGRKP